jgi:hypothetical protein
MQMAAAVVKRAIRQHELERAVPAKDWFLSPKAARVPVEREIPCLPTRVTLESRFQPLMVVDEIRIHQRNASTSRDFVSA